MRTQSISAVNCNSNKNQSKGITFQHVGVSETLAQKLPKVADMVVNSKAIEEATKGKNYLLDLFCTSVVPKVKGLFGYNEMKGNYMVPERVTESTVIQRLTGKTEEQAEAIIAKFKQ